MGCEAEWQWHLDRLEERSVKMRGHLVSSIQGLGEVIRRRCISRVCRQHGFPGHPLWISNIFKFWAYTARAFA